MFIRVYLKTGNMTNGEGFFVSVKPPYILPTIPSP